MTQWIFNSDNCSCLAPEKQGILQLCPLCGYRQKTNSGSITQWIFKPAQCKCDVKHAPLEEQQLPKEDVIAASPYEFIGVAGTGGVGTVYKARSKKLNRTVAIKAINPSLSETFDAQRFEREARSISKLQHPNVLSIIDFGSMQDGRQYLVSEWIEGLSLAEYIKRHGVLSARTAEEVFCALLDGLSHAHTRHIIHRDIKPGNIMLGKTGLGWVVKLIDFGASKDTATDQSTTRIEDMAFSPYYVSPERVGGAACDARSDLYSLGCTMFEALTGRPPFTGKAMMVAMRHQSEAPPKLSDVSNAMEFPEYLEEFVSKLLAKNPAERFQNAQEAKAALEERARSGTGTTGPKGKLTAPLVVLTVVVVIIGVIVCVALAPQEQFFEKPLRTDNLNVLKNQKADELVDLGAKTITTPQRDTNFFDAPEWTEVVWEGGQRWKCPSFASDDDDLEKVAKKPEFSYISLNTEKRMFTSRGLLALCKQPHLRGLALAKTDLSPEQLDIVLSNAHDLEVLTIGENPQLTDTNLHKLAKLKKLRALDLYGGNFTDGCLVLISLVPSLEHLKIGKLERFTGAQLEFLAPLKKLMTLSLKDNVISGEGWKQLAALKQITLLNISGTNLNTNILQGLLGMRLERLSIANTDVTDKGFLTLKQMKTLRVLHAWGCGITAEAAHELARALPNCQIVMKELPEDHGDPLLAGPAKAR